MTSGPGPLRPAIQDRTGTNAARRWIKGHNASAMLALAAALVVVALALPWQSSQLVTSVSPTFIPGSCIATYDGSLDCLPGFVGFGTNTSLSPPQPGFSQPIRVFAVLAGLLVWQAVRRRAARLAVAGLAFAVLGLAGAGFGSRSGPAVYIVALIIAVIALRRAGLLTRRVMLART